MSPSKPQKRTQSTKSDLSSSSSPSSTLSTSFLFIVKELTTNDDPEVAGSIGQNMVDYRWRPPIVTQGFFYRIPDQVYRWRNGDIELASSYRWFEDKGVVREGTHANDYSQQTMPYEVMTVFYCNQFDNFMATPSDVTVYDIDSGTDPYWFPLSFRHRQNGCESISDVNLGEEHLHLQVRKAGWIGQVLPKVYRNPSEDGPNEGGLAGSLPLLIALVAFSCEGPAQLKRILIHRHSWAQYKWTRHEQTSGRKERRGMVVTVFLDPDNPNSTSEKLFQLQFESGPLIQ